MAKVDKLFKKMITDILSEGCSTENEQIRSKWKDGSPAFTHKTFGVVNTYDLSKEFPALTLRPTPFKTCIDEILWIWQKKSNKVSELNSKIWDQWVDNDGTIGKAYGYQAGKVGQNVKDENGNTIKVDQTDYILNQLKHNPTSRRIIANLYNIEELDEMELHPCCYSFTLNVTGDKLNMLLNQRSQDLIVAGNWNVVQYAVLLHMFAQVSGFKVGKLVHVIADCHIYNRHMDIAKELVSREGYPAPTLWINPEITNFYDFTVDDFRLYDYIHYEQISNIPVSI